MDLDPIRDLPVKRVLDIGANAGWFYSKSRKTWRDASHVLIDGNPKCLFDLLRATAHDKKATVRIELLSNISGERVFYTTGDTCTGDSMYKEIGQIYEGCQEVILPASRLDSLSLGKFDLIKIDVQGGELDVLKGGPKTVQGAICIILEVSDRPYNKGAPLTPEVVEYMRGIGFGKQVVLANNPDIGQRDIAFLKG